MNESIELNISAIGGTDEIVIKMSNRDRARLKSPVTHYFTIYTSGSQHVGLDSFGVE